MSETDIHGVAVPLVRMNERTRVRKVACKWLKKNVRSAISMFVPFLWANIKKKRELERKQAIWLKSRGGIDNNVFKEKTDTCTDVLVTSTSFLCVRLFFLSLFFYQLLCRHLSKCVKRSRDSFTALK